MDYHGIDIKLVNVQTFEGHDTKLGLNADIVYNGKKIAHVYDSAHGGCFEYTVLGDIVKNDKGEYEKTPERIENQRLFKELEERIAALPEVTSTSQGFTGKEVSWRQDLDWVVDQVFEHQENEKMEKKKKMYNKGILYREGDSEYVSSWKGFTLTKLAKHPKGLPTIQAAYLSLKNKKGVEILNLERLKKIGVDL